MENTEHFMTVRHTDTNSTYDEVISHSFMWEDLNEPNPVKRAHIIIDKFNSGLRKGESAREVVAVKDSAGKILWSEGDEV